MNLPAVIPPTLLVQDLDGRDSAVLNPVTGEVVPLDDVAGLADWKLAVKQVNAAFKEAADLVNPAIVAQMDRDARWTINRPGGSVSAPSPAPSQASDTWDGHDLYLVLERLMQDGVISAQALADAVEIKTEYVAKSAGVKALLKLPVVAPYIESCRVEPPEKKRSVNVK